jgi:uncharacterized RDD family membrane protein YckC
MTDDHQDETQELGGAPPGGDPTEQPTVPLASGQSHPTPGGVRTALLKDGARFGRYRVIRELGRGGMGVVYEAEDTETGRLVALKLLPTIGIDSLKKRFVREGRLAAQISHPNSVYVFEADEIDDVPVIAMEIIRGGTLTEWVSRDGPLPVHIAVDCALQVIAGLREAEGRGILHRDVKPSNCFIEQDGTVKVGDYGLSMSTSLGPESTRLTTDGSQLGTPAYAPPEQMRGRETDVRSDIYSVGATLYYLLTGRAPFEAANPVELIAKVLGDPVTPPSSLRAGIPKGLERVVLRCLSREPDRRYADYDQVAKALAPFRAQPESSASLSTRFSAGFIDQLVLSVVGMIFGATLGAVNQAPEWNEIRVSEFLMAIGSALVYYGVLEGIWGASLGKRTFGLRVARVDGRPPGMLRAVARVMIYASGSLILLLTSSRWVAFAFGWSFLLLWVTARRHNGFAAIHDLLTGTRVVHRHAASERVRLDLESARTVARPDETIEPREVGPFEVIAELRSGPSGRLLLGHDPRLRRDVWLHLSPPGTPALDQERRDRASGGRLRWLGGRREGSECWDAYEAPNGAAFCNVAAKPQPWSSVGRWLDDVAREVVEYARQGTQSESFSTGHVWIGADGRARLLDSRLGEPQDSNPSDAYDMAESEQQRLFLLRLAREALEGESSSDEELQRRPVATPMPLHARSVVEDLRTGTIGDGAALNARLEAIADRPAEVDARRRLIQLGIQSGLPGFMGIAYGMGMVVGVGTKAFDSVRQLILVFAVFIDAWLLTIAPFACLAVVTAFLFRGGATLRALQIAVVDGRGVEIGRSRAALRALVAWGLTILLFVCWAAVVAPAVVASLDELEPSAVSPEASSAAGQQLADDVVRRVGRSVGRTAGALLIATGPIVALFFCAGLIYAVRNPSRGLQDRVLRTELVPR